MNIGEKFYFKTQAGRGHPLVGEVVSETKNFVTFNTSSRGKIRVNKGMVKSPYKFKPYKKNSKKA